MTGSTFYDLDLAERLFLVSSAVDNRKTLISRWEALPQEATEGWLARAHQAASLLGPQMSVADVGCGMMVLERFLETRTRYVPVDVVARDARTVVVDLNQSELPDLKTSSIVALGLLEYIFDTLPLLMRMAKTTATIVVSYNPLDLVPDTEQRMGHAWVNHYTIAELECLFLRAGLHVQERRQIDSTQYLWKLISG